VVKGGRFKDFRLGRPRARGRAAEKVKYRKGGGVGERGRVFTPGGKGLAIMQGTSDHPSEVDTRGAGATADWEGRGKALETWPRD